MASSYTTGFSLEKISTGEQSGTWGTTSNHNWDIVDRLASYKAVAITTNADTATLTVREASPGSGTENLQDGMYRAVKFTGALDSNCTVTIAPNTAPAWFIIENATTDSGSSGPYSIILSQGSGANVTVQNGKNVIVYCDGAGSGAAVIDALADLQVGTLECTGAAAIDGAATFSSTVTVGVDDTGYDVKFFGDTASRYWLWDTSADGVVQRGTLTIGVDDTGYDVKLFGATSGAYLLWDESADDLKLVGAAGLTVAGDVDVDGTTNLDAVDVDGAVNFAADVTFADGADIITASAGTSNFRAGVNAGNSIESGGNYNVAVGDEAGTAITTGDGNVAIGYAALDTASTGSRNTIIGHQAGDAITTGSDNTAVGNWALKTATDVSYNTAVGTYALKLATGASNTAVGYNAGTAISSGTNNTAVGALALISNTTATNNVAIGYNTAYAVTTAGQITAVGSYAGDAITTGANNTVVGHYAGSSLTTGAQSVAIGSYALQTATDPVNSVCVGHDAGKAITTGDSNTYIGQGTGTATTTGGSNTAIGNVAGDVVTTGSNNLCIGINTDPSVNSALQETAIGYGAIGKGMNTAFISSNGGPVYAGNNSANFSTTSDRRIKKNIVDNNIGLEKINQIQVRNFKYRTPDEIDELPSHSAIKQEGIQLGVIAQEVQDFLPQIVDEASTGCLSVDGSDIKWILVNAVKELSAQVKELQEWKEGHTCGTCGN